MLLPGEIEDLTRAERERDGVPIDAGTFEKIVAAGESVGVPRPA